jgi:hypothetical protein
MAKKARMANLSAMRGVNIFKDGIPGVSQESEEAETVTQAEAAELPASESPEASLKVGPETRETALPDQKPEKKILRSYHLPESLIRKLEDAHMVYSLKKVDKSKQDIVTEALEKHFAELEQQGLFQILDLLRN